MTNDNIQASNDETLLDRIEKDSFVGHLDSYDGSRLRGWAANLESSKACVLDVFVNGEAYRKVEANEFRADLSVVGVRGGHVSFDMALPIAPLIKKYGYGFLIQVRYATTKLDLVGSPIMVQRPQLASEIQVLNSNIVEGWVFDANNPAAQLQVQVWVDGACVATVFANEECVALKNRKEGNIFHGYKIYINEFTNGKESIELELKVDLIETHTIQERTLIPSSLGCLLALEKLQNLVRESELLTDQDLNTLGKILPSAIQSIRQDQFRLSSHEILAAPSLEDDIRVAVVIPVYRDVELTKHCISSVLESRNHLTFRVLVINDSSPELEMQAMLDEFRSKGLIELFINRKNLGFVKTANKAMELAGCDDIVLLNSDTRVGEGWLDALKSVAYEEKMIGTVTPLSNNATIFSFPQSDSNNRTLSQVEFNHLIQACKLNQTSSISVPTAHGFCMYIKRSLMDEIGFFDANLWGDGYGEENDFSVKALALGWKNVATNKTFVMHYGSVSFKDSAIRLQQDNIQTLLNLYPDYSERVTKFIEADSLRSLRLELFENAVLNHCRSKGNLRRILFVNHGVGGGTLVAANNLAKQLVSEGVEVIFLYPNSFSNWRLEFYESAYFGEYVVSEDYDRVINFLKKLNVFHIHYHHVLQFSEVIWELPKRLGCEFDVSIHDFYFICPRITLSDTVGRYCGEPEISDCNSCISKNGVSEGISSGTEVIDIMKWRSDSKTRLSQARKVFTPSKYVFNKVKKYFGLNNVSLNIHIDDSKYSKVSRKNRGEYLHIGVLGAISEIKGLMWVKKLASYIDENNLPAKVIIIGYTSNDSILVEHSCVEISGMYSREDLVEKVEEYSIDVFFMSSTVPETYSFVLTEIVQMGFPIVAFNIGAVAERVKEMGCGKLTQLDAPVEEIYIALQDCTEDVVIPDNKIIKQYDSPILDSYYGLTSSRKKKLWQLRRK